MTDNNQGFTLIEFLVSIVILMVGMMGLLQSINLAMVKNVESVFRNEAIAVANDRMMELTGKSFNSLSTTTATGTVKLFARSPRGLFKNYSARGVVTQLTGIGQTGVPASKKVDVTVSWRYKQNMYSHSASSVLSTTNAQ